MRLFTRCLFLFQSIPPPPFFFLIALFLTLPLPLAHSLSRYIYIGTFPSSDIVDILPGPQTTTQKIDFNSFQMASVLFLNERRKEDVRRGKKNGVDIPVLTAATIDSGGLTGLKIVRRLSH